MPVRPDLFPRPPHAVEESSLSCQSAARSSAAPPSSTTANAPTHGHSLGAPMATTPPASGPIPPPNQVDPSPAAPAPPVPPARNPLVSPRPSLPPVTSPRPQTPPGPSPLSASLTSTRAPRVSATEAALLGDELSAAVRLARTMPADLIPLGFDDQWCRLGPAGPLPTEPLTCTLRSVTPPHTVHLQPSSPFGCAKSVRRPLTHHPPPSRTLNHRYTPPCT